VPVVASSSSSLPEVVGDAGLLADPGDAGALAMKIASILDNPGREAELRARGPAQAARFRWDRAAQEMEEVFFEALR
jgi:glycosyltransferase involved in cell wall biosynthesis